MAYIVIDSKFKPFNYDELVKPVQQATEAHIALEDKYSTMAEQANVWENIIDKDLDPELYDQYKQYADALDASAEQLAREGLTPGSRKSLMEMRKRYSKDIVPIDTAYKRKQEEIKRQQDISDKAGGKVVFSRNAVASPLSAYVKGDNDFKQINLDAVYKENMEGAAAISSRYFNTVEGQSFKNDYYRLIETTGIAPGEAVSTLIASGDYPALTEFYRLSLDRTGYNKDGYSSNDQNRVMSSALQGIATGLIYKEKNVYRDAYADDRLQLDKDQFQLMKDRFEFEKQKWEDAEAAEAEAKANASGGGSKKERKPFYGLQFRLSNKGTKVSDFQHGLTYKAGDKEIAGFEKEHESLMPISMLPGPVQASISTELAKYGLTVEDVVLYKDNDFWTKDHYQIRLNPRKYNQDGTYTDVYIEAVKLGKEVEYMKGTSIETIRQQVKQEKELQKDPKAPETSEEHNVFD